MPALHTFVEAFNGFYKNGVTEGRDFRSTSGMLFRFAIVLRYIKIRFECALSLSILIIIVQPYKKHYMNVFVASSIGGISTTVCVLCLSPAFI